LVYARAAEGIIWVERGGLNGDPPTKVIAYLEGNVTIDYQTGTDGIVKKDTALLAKISEKTWLGRFSTTAPIKGLKIAAAASPPAQLPAIYERGMDAREPKFPHSGQDGSIRRAELGSQRAGRTARFGSSGPNVADVAFDCAAGRRARRRDRSAAGAAAGDTAVASLSAQRYAFAVADVSRIRPPVNGSRSAIRASNLVVDGMEDLGAIDVFVRPAGDVDPAGKRAADGWKRHGARPKRSARAVPGREHCVSPGGPGTLRQPDVLRRAPQGGRRARRGNERRRADL